MIDEDRVCVWPDDTWCYEDDLPEMGHMSDDYQIIPAQFFFVDNVVFGEKEE